MTYYSAFIFDLDGTLIDSAPDIAAAVNTHMISKGYPLLEVDYVERFIGNGPRRLLLDMFLDKGLPADDVTVDRAVASYIENYKRDPASRTRFFPDVRDDLFRLHHLGVRLGICTNKPHGLTQQILEILGLSKIIDVALGADAVPACKPDPRHLLAVAQAMGLADGSWAYIGDTDVDKATADAIDAPFFVVPWGSGPNVDVNPERRLRRIGDLSAYVDTARLGMSAAEGNLA